MELKKQKNITPLERQVIRFQKKYPDLYSPNEANWLHWILKKDIKVSYPKVILSLSNPSEYIVSNGRIEDESLLDVIHMAIRKSIKKDITWKLGSEILSSSILIYWLNFENTFDISPVNNTVNLILALLLMHGKSQFISFFIDAKLRPEDVYKSVMALSTFPFESYFDENGDYLY